MIGQPPRAASREKEKKYDNGRIRTCAGDPIGFRVQRLNHSATLSNTLAFLPFAAIYSPQNCPGAPAGLSPGASPLLSIDNRPPLNGHLKRFRFDTFKRLNCFSSDGQPFAAWNRTLSQILMPVDN